ncbi:hypothetical protein MHY1_01111 [Methylovirgula sp. HY1]|nr:hypothetical protein MHY1_01111 [Methylovirgula sp. HY1]
MMRLFFNATWLGVRIVLQPLTLNHRTKAVWPGLQLIQRPGLPSLKEARRRVGLRREEYFKRSMSFISKPGVCAA